MTIHQKSPAPIIAAGMGHELPDHYAAKVVNRWLEHLHEHETRDQLRAIKTTKQGRGIGGTPQAQLRFIERVRKGLGDSLLNISAKTGKRARFSFVWDILQAGAALVDRETNWDGTAPRWVYMMRSIYRKQGPQSELEEFSFAIAAVSHHALVRIVQRGGVERYADMVKVARVAWHSLCLIELATRYTREEGKQATVLVPFRMPTGVSDIGAFVVSPNNNSSAMQLTPVATTFISGTMMGDEQYMAVSNCWIKWRV
jgi:hypothetical protein